MKRNTGFTIIELVTALTLVCIVGTLIIVQKNDIDTSARDKQRKTALNALYYGLTEGYYKQNKGYPVSIKAETLPYVDPALFKTVGDDTNRVRYIGRDCQDGACQGFELRVKLEKEAEYKKAS